MSIKIKTSWFPTIPLNPRALLEFWSSKTFNNTYNVVNSSSIFFSRFISSSWFIKSSFIIVIMWISFLHQCLGAYFSSQKKQRPYALRFWIWYSNYSSIMSWFVHNILLLCMMSSTFFGFGSILFSFLFID